MYVHIDASNFNSALQVSLQPSLFPYLHLLSPNVRNFSLVTHSIFLFGPGIHITVAELLIHTPVNKQTYQLEYNIRVPFFLCLAFVSQTYLGLFFSHSFLPLWLFSFGSVCIPLPIPPTSWLIFIYLIWVCMYETLTWF